MRLTPGETIIPFTLPAIDGTEFDLSSLNGRPYLLSFFRFAGCPFCNLRVHQLVAQFEQFGDDFTIVAIFDSPLDNLIAHAEGHAAPFPILADPENRVYEQYGIEHSVMGMLKGMVFRMPTLMHAVSEGYSPKVYKGSLTTMPADFLVDRQGIIQTAYYAKDEGDHLPMDQVQAFSMM